MTDGNAAGPGAALEVLQRGNVVLLRMEFPDESAATAFRDGLVAMIERGYIQLEMWVMPMNAGGHA